MTKTQIRAILVRNVTQLLKLPKNGAKKDMSKRELLEYLREYERKVRTIAEHISLLDHEIAEHLGDFTDES